MDDHQEIASLGARMSAVEHRVAKHGEEIETLKVNDAKLDVILARVDTTVDIIDKKLDELGAKPGERWEAVIGQIIAIIVAAVVAAIVAKFGL